MKTLYFLAALLFSAQWLFAQDTQSPLPLYISGSGKVVPFQDGDMLDDGRDYVMTAVPDSDWAFTNWVPVNIYTSVLYVRDPQTDQITTATSIDFSPDYAGGFKDRALHFTMQPEEEIVDVPGLLEITWSQGWEANFIPAPQKGDAK